MSNRGGFRGRAGAAARALALALLAPVAAAAPAPAAGEAAGEGPALVLAHANDWDRMEARDGAGGAARIAAAIRRERDRAEAAGAGFVATFGGDMISPSLLSGIDKGAHMIALADAAGFDVAVVGNHEFDFGPEVLRARLAESKTVWLAGNVSYRGADGFPGARATWTTEAGGYRIGFLGLTTPETATISSPGPDVAFRPVAEAGAALAARLRADGADIVVALTHQGAGRDRALLREVPGIDIVLGGHDHLVFARHDGRQAILKAGSQGRHLGVLDLAIRRVERRGGPRAVWTPSFRLESTAGIAPDERVAAMVAGYRARLDRDLGRVVGRAETELDTSGSASVSGETAFGNLIADAIRAATGADIGFTNGGGIRGDRFYPAGSELTRADILGEMPFGNRVVKLRLDGAALRATLEIGARRPAHGGFPQVSGLAWAFDARRPPGERVVRVSVGGEPLDPARLYTLATNDFLARGGDGYTTLRDAEILVGRRSGPLMAGVVIDAIAAAGSVAPRVEGRTERLD